MTTTSMTVGQRRRWQLLAHTPNDWALQNLWFRPERFVIGTTGRQVGKTSEAALRIDMGMNAERHPLDKSDFAYPTVGVLGAKYEKAELSVDRYIEKITKAFGRNAYRLNQNDHELEILDPAAGKPGAKLKWISAEEAYNTVGFTFSHIVVDEAQAIPDDVYQKFRPTWGVRHASADIFGTPDTLVYQTWFQGLWTNGQSADDPLYHSFSVATWDAPWMTMEEILDAKRGMSENEFLRLYGGRWLADQGQVFTKIDPAFLPRAPQYDPDRRYLMAVDFAVHEDFNVAMVGDPATRRVIHRERWSNTDPLATYDRIEEIWDRFGRPHVWADETGMGLPMVADLRHRGMRVHGTTFTAQNKMEMVKQLAGDLQHGRFMFPEDWNDFLQELGSFVFVRTPAGRLTAAARVGAHDDLVMTAVLLNQGFRTRGNRVESFQRNYLTGGTDARAA